MFKNPSYLNSSLWDTLSGEYYRSVKTQKDFYNAYDFWQWDENLINESLKEYDGQRIGRYRAAAGHLGVEQGDWLLSAELARAHSDLIDSAGWTAQLGASRFVGRNGLLGGAIRLQGGASDPGGLAILAEAGLRF